MGPGVIFAAMAIGSGELILTTRSGALYGYALAWVAVVTLIFKAALTAGLARLTVATGDDIFASFAALPKTRFWANGLVLGIFALETVGYGGIALAAGTAINGLLPDVPMKIGATAIVFASPLILASGSYGLFEKVMFVLVVALVAGVVYCAFSVTVPTREMIDGFMPSIPDGSSETIMGLMGWVGAGLSTLLYSSWVKEKIGGGRDQEDYRTWLATVRLDYCLAYVLIFLISLCFLVLGATTLRGQNPEREQTMAVLSQMLSGIPYGRPIFLVTALFTLFSTILAGLDGRGRAFASILSSSTARFGSRLTIYRTAMGLLLVLMTFAIVFGKPVQLIRFVSAVVAVTFGLVGFMLLYVDHHLPKYARGSIAWQIVIVLGSTTFLFVAIYKAFVVIAKFI